MATRNETRVVYSAGVVQGIVLVTFPAASTIFTDPSEYDLSSTQYRALRPRPSSPSAWARGRSRLPADGRAPRRVIQILGTQAADVHPNGMMQAVSTPVSNEADLMSATEAAPQAEGKSLETVTKPLTSVGEETTA
jgi:hypothetical protein